MPLHEPKRFELKTDALKPGKITRLVYQKEDGNRVSVFIDGDFAFGAHVDLVVKYGLAKGKVLSEAVQHDILLDDAAYRARAVALRFLALRARTSAEVERRLRRANYPESAVTSAIEYLQGHGLLDDAAYAREYVAARRQSRGLGPTRIKNELLKRGVDRAVIEDAVDAAFSDADILSAALQQAQKPWRQSEGKLEPARRRKKVFDYLLRRGYDFDVAREVVDSLQNDETAP